MSSTFSKLHAGFTLIEMMVVVGIFIIITGIVLSNFSGFRQKSAIDLLAREISLVIRQAQVYGTATRNYPGVTGRFPSYGIYLEQGAANFMMFADKNGNGLYDGSAENVEQFNLTGGATVSSLDYCDASGCAAVRTGGPGSASWKPLNINFVRPDVGASFKVQDGGGSFHEGEWSNVTITIQDRLNPPQEREIKVWRTGHIYVESELG